MKFKAKSLLPSYSVSNKVTGQAAEDFSTCPDCGGKTGNVKSHKDVQGHMRAERVVCLNRTRCGWSKVLGY